MSYMKSIRPKPPVPQSKPLDERQVKNDAGGYSYQASDWERLERFLIIGTLAGTYYVGEDKLTEQNLELVKALLYEDGQRVVNMVVGISTAGRAPSNSPALLVLAMAASLKPVAVSKALPGSNQTDAVYCQLIRMSALFATAVTCRTASMLMEFVAYCKQFRGWGRGLRSAVAAWYENRDASSLAYQMVKYRERRGYSHRDMLMLGHPQLTDSKGWLAKWALGKELESVGALDRPDDVRLISAFEQAQKTTEVGMIARLVTDYNLPMEAVPNTFYGKPELWQALLPKLPLNAAMRNLTRMANANVLYMGSEGLASLIDRLGNLDAIRKSRLHPFRILYAMNALRNSGAHVHPALYDALNKGFELSFANVAPSGKRILLGIDVSGSMKGSFATVRNPGKNAANNAVTLDMACAAMAMMVLRTERNSEVVAFDTTTRALPFSASTRLDDALGAISRMSGGGTDCAQPILWAHGNHRPFDAIVILTDNQTWQGHTHPAEAMKAYRRVANVPGCKLIVVAMAPNHYTVGDPQDELSMNIVGFDAGTPSVISAYLGGTIDNDAEAELS